MHFITISHIFSFLFSVISCLTHVYVLFCLNRNKMSQKTEMKSESWEFCSFPKGSMGTKVLFDPAEWLCFLHQVWPWTSLSPLVLFSQAWQAHHTQFLAHGLIGGPHGNRDLALVTPEYYTKFSWEWFKILLWLNPGLFNHIFQL